VLPTVLDGFTVLGRTDPTNAAITVDAATGASITNNIVAGGTGATSIGIQVQNAATPTISRNGISGGLGSVSSFGVRSQRAAPMVRGNCGGTDALGRCNIGGCNNLSMQYIRGRSCLGAGCANASSDIAGVMLEGSPNAVVDQNGICSVNGAPEVSGVRIVGNAAGVIVRANHVLGAGASRSGVGVWMDPCGGTAPWIVNNFQIAGSSTTVGARCDGVRAIGACHPVIDSNVRIVGGVEAASVDAYGVYCTHDPLSGVGSRCEVLGNTLVQGCGGGFPPTAIGVRCDDGACARIERNVQITGGSGAVAIGVSVGNTGTFIDRNTIETGIATRMAIGLLSTNSRARVQNNIIRGPTLATIAAPSEIYGVRVFLSAGMNEIDFHSNDVFANGGLAGCISRAMAFDATPGGIPPSGRGIVRNNILDNGICPVRYGIEEATAFADPRVVENNDFWSSSAGGVATLYRDEAATNLLAVALVNALLDITVSNNLSANPLLDPTNHLLALSPCRNTGTAAGGPALDFDGQTRPREAVFDIGADEYVP